MFTAPLAGTMASLPVISSPPPLLPTSKQFSKSKANKRDSTAQEPPTLSGFKMLKSLSVLDIDNLELITELKTCVRNSSATLTELHLSLSDSLALQARRPPPDSDPDDSDVDDEFQVVPVSQNNSFDASGPAKTFRSQEERKLQEGVLGRIFDVEPFILKKPALNQSPREAATSQEEGLEAENNDNSEDPREEFVSSLRSVSTRLMTQLNGTRDISTAQQDILDIIEKAARKYVDSSEPPSQQPNDSSESAAATSTDEEQQSGGNDQASSGPVDTPSLDVRPKNKTSSDDLSPDDIEIEHLDTVDDLEAESDEQQGKEPEEKQIEPEESEKPDAACSSAAHSEDQDTNSKTTSTAGLNKIDTSLNAQRVNYESLLLELQQLQDENNAFIQQVKAMSVQGTVGELQQFTDSVTQLKELSQRTERVQDAIKTTHLEIKEIENQVSGKSQIDGSQNSQRSIDEYLRNTRGIALETLGIHLIPVKASVLSRAIDLKCIRNLTLLNVGNQAPIWTLLSKENKTSPLALRSVFTDNISTAFLNCMSQLEELHDLFLLERSAKQKPESFAPRTTVTIDQIRRLVLKKHMHTLKRLMIKDESNSSGWDANQKAMILICNRGVQLEELALSMNIHAVVSLLQSPLDLANICHSTLSCNISQD
jgi:hypothetical protein